MIDRVVVRRSSYHDSIALMLVTRDVQAAPGVIDAAVAAGTPLNLTLLKRQSFAIPVDVGPNDLVVAVRAETEEAAAAALDQVDRHLRTPAAGSRASAERPAASVLEAARRDPSLSLAFVSVPGRHAAYEIAGALEAGLDVFCFSSGPTIEQEAALKRRARERALLLMGPDCGTAIVDGIGLGFANAVGAGPVGVVAASGTGSQELVCLLDAAGVGVSQLVGVGGRDLRGPVGGLMTLSALERLAADVGTEVVVVVSKPPDPGPAEAVRAAAESLGKPVVLAFPGGEAGGVGSVEEAARAAAALVGATIPEEGLRVDPPPTPGHVRGVFSGGSLCSEAMSVVAAALGPVRSNAPLRPDRHVDGLATAEGHTFIDFGDEEFTEGRPHPMIDPSLRDERFAEEAKDPAVGVVVADVVLGHGAHPDPAGALAPLVRTALEARPGDLTVIVAVCGARNDPQDPERQVEKLREAGALVVRSAAEAGRLAAAAAGPR